jgi:aminopeptidase N
LLVWWAAFPGHALADEPFSFDAAPGRLPKDVVPISYDVTITPDVDALTVNGRESVLLQFRSATDSIEFNSLGETLSDVRFDGKPAKGVVSNDEKEWTTVTLAEPAAVGKHKLTFSYTGKIETQPRGLFAQHYVAPGGVKGVLLSTQMEATDARRMFPCWDEPAFRATFHLSATVPTKWATVSNMPVAARVTHGEVTTTSFHVSPKMPSYLIEFSAGELARVADTSEGVGFGVWAVRGQEQYGKEALANAQRILADYNDYFGYRYPLPKLDSIAVPGGFTGAMENWGAITYNDQLLLVTPSSTVADRQGVFSVQAHEMAHQWNGDLVTMGWWDDLWLNESFASWMAAKETARRFPDWHWWEGQDSSKERAMDADARAASHAIQVHVTDELQATNAFDPAITYNKGQAILRMFEAYLGESTFRSGIRSYIKARAFSNATSADLWKALDTASGKEVGQIAAGWVQQPGYPLVTAEASCAPTGERTVTLNQSRFLLQDGSDSGASHWSVPLQVRIGAAAAPQAVLLKEANQTLAAGHCDEPFTLDADAIGFFRVRYDRATLKTNTASFGKLPAGDKIALLDDQWALVGTGLEPLASYLGLADSMGPDLDARAWDQIESALGTIEYAERGSPGHDAFAAFARTLIKPTFEQLGWDAKPHDDPAVQNLRRSLLQDLGSWGDDAVIAEARKRFEAFVRDRSTISPDDQDTVLYIVALNADANTFDRLHDVAKSAKNETELRRYYAVLAEVRDDSLAERTAQIALSPEIPPQADSLRLSLIGSLAARHQQLSWKTFTNNADALLVSHAPFGPYIAAQYGPQLFWSGVPLDQVDAWIRGYVPKEMSANVDRGMDGARFRLARKQALVPAADAYVQAQAAGN